MVKSVVVMIVMLLQSFLYSYAGDNLRDQSEALSFAVYDSNWCDFPSNDVRDLAFIMSAVVMLPSIELQMGCNNAEQNVDSFMCICCALLSIVKTVCFRVYADNLSVAYNAAIDDYLTIKDPEQRKLMRRFAFIGRTLSCFMVCFAYFACVVYTLIPLLRDEPASQLNATNEDTVLEYTIPSRCTFEYFHAPTSMYKIITLSESLMMVLTCTCNHGNDSMFLNITLHVCGQVKILKADFVDIDVTNPHVHSRLNALIERHGHLVRLGNKLADTISFILLTQLFITCILLCIMGFQFVLALKQKDVVMLAKSCMVLTSFLMQISVYSFVGDYFKAQMEEVGLFLYQSAWYGLPTKLTRNLTFIIMRSQSPVKLQAGNFIVSAVVILPSIELQMGCTDAELNVDSLMFICCGLVSIVKTVCFRVYADNLSVAYNAAIDDYLTIKDPEQRKLMRRFAFIGRTLSCSMVCFAYFACVVYTLIPLLGDEPTSQFNATDEDTVLEYTIPSRCTFEYFHAPTSMYKIITLSESLMMVLTCTCNHGNTCLMSQHLHAIYEVYFII
ncbi:Putative odorant receptor 13a [Harpegnathos saltator]|uniref:Putative odorant receptor 13a n=1 Tax=Harpegnathos saltator TaxID=610380 RepID=E2B438_HARSA|nr:Putative odorant receptor 13a [Harpegnathos saltator]